MLEYFEHMYLYFQPPKEQTQYLAINGTRYRWSLEFENTIQNTRMTTNKIYFADKKIS
jgi:hypothetical protein